MFTHHKFFMPMLGVGLILAGQARAEDQAGALDALKKQMTEMQSAMQKMQELHQQEITALKTQVETQQKTIDDLKKNAPPAMLPLPEKSGENPPAPGANPLFPTTDPSVVANAPPGAAPATTEFPTTDAAVVAGGAVSPTTPATGINAPITIAGGGKTFLNISFDAMFSAASSSGTLDRLEVGDHDPQHRGFNARNLEIALDGAVDPYLEGFANIVFKLDNSNGTSVEVEEAFMQTTSLPWGLELKGGQFFAPFGRINPTHPHTWDFVDAPLVHGRLLGPDGLRGVGLQAAWVIPVSWYSQLLVALQNGEGGTAHSFRNPGEDGTFFGRKTIARSISSFGDMLFAPRWENSIDITPQQTVLFGVSGAFGANDTGQNARTQIYGADLFYKWKPSNAAGGWPFVKWQSEVMWRRFDAGRGADNAFPSEQFHDWGAYTQVVWGFKERWTAGVRGDWLHMADSSVTNDPDRQSRQRISADVTWYPSEFSKLRLQYNHDLLRGSNFTSAQSENSVFLQFEFALGAHGAHKY